MIMGYGGSAGLVLQDENTSFQNTPCNFREVFYHYITNTIIISIPIHAKTPCVW